MTRIVLIICLLKYNDIMQKYTVRNILFIYYQIQIEEVEEEIWAAIVTKMKQQTQNHVSNLKTTE